MESAANSELGPARSLIRIFTFPERLRKTGKGRIVGAVAGALIGFNKRLKFALKFWSRGTID